MKIRKLISLIAFLSFFVMALTGIVMFLAPQSRVAYWSGWELFGLSKRDYDNIHSTFMLLFLTSIIWHTVLNWNSLVDYLRSRRKKLTVFTGEFTFALVICIGFFVGTLLRFTPFDQYLGLASTAKRYWVAELGSPPWAPADATPLGKFCHEMEGVERLNGGDAITIDCDEAVVALKEAGIEIDDVSQALDDIAAANGTTPRAIAEVVMTVARPESDTSTSTTPD